jgi:multicomponent Na+:H+ antiporter subunit E
MTTRRSTVRPVAGRVALVVWLVVLWQLLWRDVSAANIASGLVVAVLVAAIPLPLPPVAAGHRVRPLGLLLLLGRFAWLVVVANLTVAREIVTRRDNIRSGIVAIPLTSRSPLVTTVLADVITLTPGTLSLEVDPERGVLYVHVLHVRAVEDVRRDIEGLQRLVLAAIEPPPASPERTR